VRGLKARRVHGALDTGHQGVVAEVAVELRAAGVSGERDGQDVVASLQGRYDQVPGAPGVGEAVQEHERFARSSAMLCCEPRAHER
jgi:hypothetical protein